MCNLYKTKSSIGNSEQLLSARPSGPTYPPACLQEHSAKPAMHQPQSSWAYKSFLDMNSIFAHRILGSMTFNLLKRSFARSLSGTNGSTNSEWNRWLFSQWFMEIGTHSQNHHAFYISWLYSSFYYLHISNRYLINHV